MRKSLFGIVLCATMLSFVSCGNRNYTQDGAGVEALGEDLQAKFGADAWYTELHLMYSDGQAVVTVTETDDPASLAMREWTWSGYTGWKQTSDVTLEITGDAAPEEFMFQLGKDVDMKLIGSLVEKSKTQLTAEKNIEKPRFERLSMSTPDDEDKSAMRIRIELQPENGGTDFNFSYNLAGELLDFDY
jgi:hypothetical protein